MNKRRIVLVALGGNAIKKPNEDGTAETQLHNVEATCKQLAQIIKSLSSDDRIVITHGNGPQVGNLAIQQEISKNILPPQPLDILGAMTQGQIGYMLQQALANALFDEGLETQIAPICTQVLVDRNDPEFIGENASKPVGPFYSKKEAMRLRNERGYIMKKVKPNGAKVWRRVVPSPKPIGIVEGNAIKVLVNAGIIVIASGGGGVPVVRDKIGHLRGVEGVIDKDLAGEKLGEVINAKEFLILTDVEKIFKNFGTPMQTEIDKMTCTEAKRYLSEGHFLKGSMGPKVEACIKFIECGGETVVITSLEKAYEGFMGYTGTKVCPDT